MWKASILTCKLTCFHVILLWALAIQVNMLLAGGSEDLSQTQQRIHDQLHSLEGPILQPEETLTLLKQVYSIGKARRELETNDSASDSYLERTKRRMTKHSELLIEASHITNEKCTKENFFSLDSKLVFFDGKPNLANYIRWCIGNQFDACKATFMSILKEKSSKLSEQQLKDLGALVKLIKEAHDLRPDGYAEALVPFVIQHGEENAMADSKKYQKIFKQNVQNLCEDLEESLAPESMIFRKLATIPEAVDHMDVQTKSIVERIHVCEYIVFEHTLLSRMTHKMILERLPKAPSDFDRLMRYMFARGKRSKTD